MKEFLKGLLEQRGKDASEFEARINTEKDTGEVARLGERLQVVREEMRNLEFQIKQAVIPSADGMPREDARGIDPMKGYSAASTNRDSITGRSLSPGEHFVKHAKTAIETRSKRFSITVPEYRANTDPHFTGGPEGPLSSFLVQTDPSIVQAYRRPTVSGLFSWGAITEGSAIEYFVEGAREGDFKTVADNELKPLIHYADPTPKLDGLKTIAGVVKIHKNMFSDLGFLVSEINGRGLYDLSIAEEYQLVYGDGSGNNIEGLLNRSGIQTMTSPAIGDNADTLFKTRALVSNSTGLAVDGIVINPLDYEVLRLSKDGNGQYYGGGFFAGQYGVGGVIQDPPIWGLRTVVSPAVAKGTAIVGSFSPMAATPYRKGGIDIESTNSNEDDFRKNLIAVRIEERIALAVRRPGAFVKVTLA